MNIQKRVSTGHVGLDQVIDQLRLGDNVVWQVDSLPDYRDLAGAFVNKANQDGRRIIYVRFGHHAPLFEEADGVAIFEANPEDGFESFTTSLYAMVGREGEQAFYVFDCLSDLLSSWHSDLMIRNFFNIMCPYLYVLDTVAYFALRRGAHTNTTIAGIRETTQLLLDLYHMEPFPCVHPLKVWKRYSSTMFLPHQLEDSNARSITSSAEASALFSELSRSGREEDYWRQILERAATIPGAQTEAQEEIRELLITMLFGAQSRMYDLCLRFFKLKDLIRIAEREIGTGFIGGKSVGMLVARKILRAADSERFSKLLEAHDSYYLGADIFYSYIVQNGWWGLRTQQKEEDGYFRLAPEFQEKLRGGNFSEDIKEQFWQMLEYFGQSPIIVRSSSLLEDNYGNAFAGKYDSVFCVNQGTPEERYRAFEQAVRDIYASTMNKDALRYRLNRGLSDKDEQMAILVQRVSGDYHGSDFYPHAAGVGNSYNLYVWDEQVDPTAGMLRLVFGLGTRAVDRTEGDYVRMVTLDQPMRGLPVHPEERQMYSQHGVDVLNLPRNTLCEKLVSDVISQDLKADKSLFVTPDFDTMQRLRERGHAMKSIPEIVDFDGLFRHTDFASTMKSMLAILTEAYDYPVDIEFTLNFDRDGTYRINLLQCRPLQTRSVGEALPFPEDAKKRPCFFYSHGHFMGGNIRQLIDYVIFVQPQKYAGLSSRDQYEVARIIGALNQKLKTDSVLLAGPGRWGTMTPSLGVPVHFAEISSVEVLCEISSDGFSPELSYGSHFFQDLVESGIFYVALFSGEEETIFSPDFITGLPNIIEGIIDLDPRFQDVIHVSKMDALCVYSDVPSQGVLCR
ncbi:MAG: pyruvate kinase [Clostridiaceae bacterium]|nr:pyruvate kinase [Clostridiaceae bacterium]